MVIRAEEAILSRSNTSIKKTSNDLLLKGVIVGKLYLGAKTRYEVKLQELEDTIFINSEEEFQLDEPVQILVREGSYFVYT